jgi:hypothetical protein
MNYPTLLRIRHASHLDVCRWYRFLPSPATTLQMGLMNAILIRFSQGGGFTPAISKQLEHERRV